MSTPGDDQDDARPVQRVVSAVDASPLHTQAASSVFTSWRKAGDQIGTVPSLDDPAPDSTDCETDTTPPTAAAPTPQGEPMAKRNGAARARKSRNGGPQLQICHLLLQDALAREAIEAALPDLTATQIYSALQAARNTDRVKWNESAGVFQLTKTGRAWVEAAGGEQDAEAAQKPKRARTAVVHRRGRRASEPAAQPAVDTSPAGAKPRAFRCAVISDGGFWMVKNGVEIELDAEEHAEMLAYLERMAEDQTA